MYDSQQAKRRPGNGFTLIELLVVIGIIAILAAILFPVFAKAKEAAKRAACLAHLRQVGIALKMYQDEWNGAYPSVAFPDTNDPAWKFFGWIKRIIPYTKSRGIFNCPGAVQSQIAGVPPMKIAYSFNEYIYRSDEGFLTESSIPVPKATLLLSDGRVNMLIMDWDDPGWMPDRVLPAPRNIPSGMSRAKWADSDGKSPTDLRERHGGSNILFCDLHARLVKSNEYKATLTPGWNNAGCKEWPVIYPKAGPYY